MRIFGLEQGRAAFAGLAYPRRASWPGGLPAFAVALLAVLLYSGLRSELPIDDTLHFGPHITAGVYEWDAAHLFMQPAAVLWHRYLGFGAPARVSQERFNAFCSAASLGLLYLLLLRLGVEPFRRALLTLLPALSFNLLNLATSGHIKLAALPFLTLSLFQAVLWEREVRQGGGRQGDGRLAASAVALGVSTSFLASSLVVTPFLAMAAMIVSRRAGSGTRRTLLRFLGTGILAGTTAFALLGAGYLYAAPGPASLEGFLGFVFAKAAVRPASSGLAESLARSGFGVLQNFVYLGDFGAMARVWMNGDGTVLGPYLRMLFSLAIVFLAALALLAWAYGGALLRLVRGRGPATPWAFVLGTVAFALPWNLNEPDFYFPLTLPTVVLLATAPPSVRRPVLETALLALVACTVLLGWSLPRKSYPLKSYNAELRALLTGRDLAVHWLEWPGGPSLIFMDLPGVARLHPDEVFDRTLGSGRFFPEMAGVVDRHLAAGGRVYLFRILDRRSWNSPWPHLRRHGLDPDRLERFFRERYTVLDRGEMAEIPCWELRPKPSAAGPLPSRRASPGG